MLNNYKDLKFKHISRKCVLEVRTLLINEKKYILKLG